MESNTPTELTGVLLPSEAILGFHAWLITRKGITHMRLKIDIESIQNLVEEFCNINNLNDPRDNWISLLKPPE